MNKFITVYELLGLIKDGKAPKMIKYKDNNYIFTGYDYRCILTDIEKGFVEYWLIGNYNQELNFLLNEKIKILEEDKPTIEKISINGKDIHKLEELGIYDVIENIESTLNEIVDKIEKESK